MLSVLLALASVPLLQIIVSIIVVGVLLWLVNAYIPMEAGIKRLLNIVVICLLVIWLLDIFGLLAFLKTMRV